MLSLDLRELELERARLARAVGACKCTGAPWGACVEVVSKRSLPMDRGEGSKEMNTHHRGPR